MAIIPEVCFNSSTLILFMAREAIPRKATANPVEVLNQILPRSTLCSFFLDPFEIFAGEMEFLWHAIAILTSKLAVPAMTTKGPTVCTFSESSKPSGEIPVQML